MLSRRHFLQTGSALALCSLTNVRALADGGTEFRIDVTKGQASLLEDTSKLTQVWGFNGSTPGPVLRVQQNKPVVVKVTNRLEQGTSVHWHGIRLENAMDGVSGLTQEPIAPGATFEYRFTPPDAGTFWYHPHNRTWEQLARGLYGALIVEGEAAGSQGTPGKVVHREHVVMVDDWRLETSGAIHEASMGSFRDWSHAGRTGNILTLNGKAYEELAVVPGERVLLRLVNAANARVMRFGVEKQKAWVVALDGQPVTPMLLGEAGVVIAPAQRADIVVDVSGKAGDRIPIVELSGQNRLVAGYLVCGAGTAAGAVDVSGVPKVPAPSIPVPDLASAREVTLSMTGGAMRWLERASYKGKDIDGRTLARTHKQMWAFNGVAGMTGTPLFEAQMGETIRMKLENKTLWPHAIHLHGHHFKVLSRSAAASPSADVGAYRDTVLLERDETVEIALVAKNPGKWMLHCHMLEHQAAGMGTWFKVG